MECIHAVRNHEGRNPFLSISTTLSQYSSYLYTTFENEFFIQQLILILEHKLA